MIRNKRIPLLSFLVALFLILLGFFVHYHAPAYYPSVLIDTHEGIEISFLNQNRNTLTECLGIVQRIENSILSNCRQCTITEKSCENTLRPSQLTYFTDSPLPYPLAHLPSGVMVFKSTNPDLASKVCSASVSVVNQHLQQATSMCYPAEMEHPYYRTNRALIDFLHLGYGLLAFSVCLLVSKFISFLIIHYEHVHSHFSFDHTDAGPQKTHVIPTPRIGGIPIMLSLLASAGLIFLLPNQFSDKSYILLLIAALPAFLGGLAEDITKKVSVRTRLGLTMISGALGVLMLGASINKLELPGIDYLLGIGFAALFFTSFAVAGITNSINLIDGYNGLASGFGIIASFALASVAAIYGDNFLCYANLAMAGAILGFFVWNWPQGRIFLGDGGAYLIGFWLAEMALLLVVRNPEISIWFAMSILVYPVFETLFTIYRRKFRHQSHPGHPDAAHLHQLIYKRLVRINVGQKTAQLQIKRNSRVAPYIWITSIFFIGIATWFPDSTPLNQIWSIGFCIGYSLLYNCMLTRKIPKILICRGKTSSIYK